MAKPATRTVDDWINASLHQYQNRNYTACIAAAQQALKLRPQSELAYNNIGAAYAGLKQWDLAVANERESLHIRPDFVVVRNNLALYTRERLRGIAAPERGRTPEDWLNASLHDYQAGKYRKSIADAKQALHLRHDYAEAYNNISASYASMRQWDKAIEAAQAALRIKPDFQLTRNNLAWAQSEKAGDDSIREH